MRICENRAHHTPDVFIN